MLQPPTDNLYKFIAIAGISIMLFSIGFGGQKYFEFEQIELELKGKMRVLEMESKSMQSETQDLLLWKESMERRHAETGKPFKHNEMAAFSKKADLLASQNRDHMRSIVQSKNYAFQVEHSRKWISIYSWSTIIGSTVGLLMSILGFILWYTRLQKYIDRDGKLGAKAKESQKKYKAAIL